MEIPLGRSRMLQRDFREGCGFLISDFGMEFHLKQMVSLCMKATDQCGQFSGAVVSGGEAGRAESGAPNLDLRCADADPGERGEMPGNCKCGEHADTIRRA